MKAERGILLLDSGYRAFVGSSQNVKINVLVTTILLVGVFLLARSKNTQA